MKRAAFLSLNPNCEFRAAFAAGLKRHGWAVDTAHTLVKPCDMLVTWGVRWRTYFARQLAAGGEVCVLERGYLADRFQWTSVSFGGGLNGRGKFRGPHTDGSRWEKHFAHLMKPWKPVKYGRPLALVMGQVLGDQALRGVDIGGFYSDAVAEFTRAGFVVKLRPHPGPKHRPVPGLAPLVDDLASADVVATWNSNSGVDAVLAGVPTVAMDPGSMAYAVAGHALERPPMPDRTAWANRLAWCQWTPAEMESGYCWEVISGR